MPLIQGCSKEAAKENFGKLLEEGYDAEQAYAISFDTALDNVNKCGEERKQEIKKGDLLG